MTKGRSQTLWAATALLPFLLSALQPVSAAEKATEPCKAEPHAQGQAAPGAGTTGDNRIGACNGVLHPPAVGDPEMVKPAPNVGELRVVPPDAVPQNNGNGTGDQPGKSP